MYIYMMKEEDRRQRYRKMRSFILCPYSFILAVVVILLHSCATTSEIPEAKNTRIIENVPFYSQESYQCGPASLASVLNYWGVNVTPDDIAKEIFSESARGTLNIDMVLYTQRMLLDAAQYRGSIEDLKKNVESGYPLVVLVDYGFSLYQVNHFMVVVGYNENGVIVNSGRDKGKFISEKYFIKAWERTKYWTLLIKPVSSKKKEIKIGNEN
jgi:ABC-type bacteriocin/lantibiotic exporter with double-glycine peptidase domain